VAQPDVDLAADRAVAPFDGAAGADSTGGTAENPYTIHGELQQAMNNLVGIIRKAEEIEQALAKLDELKRRARNMVVEGHRQYNPGWHLALDLRNMLLVSESVARAALLRTESRGGHTRDDHPGMEPGWRNKLLVCRVASSDGGVGSEVGSVEVTPQEQVPMRQDLLELFDLAELEKYYTEAELADYPGRQD
jgi:succinate dehydrogenase / fumarate reductase flavoprotein subunit